MFKRKENLLGAHQSFLKNDQLKKVIDEMQIIKANCVAFYISPSRAYQKNWNLNQSINSFQLTRMAKININSENFVVHAPLVGNLCSPNLETQKLTFDSYLADLNRIDQINVKYYNIHPGSNPDFKLGIKTIAKQINNLHTKTPNSKTTILLETMMQKGNYIGKNFNQIKAIIDLVIDKKRIGFTIDTCHVWNYGYDLTNLKKFIKQIKKEVGLKYLKALHVNDSKTPQGSNKDRHELIGQGTIGLNILQNICRNKYFRSLPKILETPYLEDNLKKWKSEIKLLNKK